MTQLSLQESLQQVKAMLQSGAYAQAKWLCQSILLKAPDCSDAHRLLGVAEFHRGDSREAIVCLERAIRLKPIAEYYDNLSFMLHESGDYKRAEVAARESLKLDPRSASAANSLGRSLRCQDRILAAVAAFRMAIENMPRFADAHCNLCNALCVLGQWQEAEEAGRTALRLGGTSAVYFNNLARALSGQERYQEAILILRSSLVRRRQNADGLKLLGVVLAKSGKLAQAESALRRCIYLFEKQQASDVMLADAVKSLAHVLMLQGAADEAVLMFRKAVQLSPASADLQSHLLECEQYRDWITAEKLTELHVEWAARHCSSATNHWTASDRSKATDRIRLGFVSTDLYEHPVGRLLAPVFEHLDRSRFESFVYSDRMPSDDLSRRIERTVTSWRFVPIADEELTDIIRADRINVLFDLAGHTVGNRLSVFARRAAPLQISWIGYVGTTGVPAMDYLLADRRHVRPEEERYYSERVLILPDGYVCFEPPVDAPAVSPLPALETGRLTFASFANPVKIQRQSIEAWASILRAFDEAEILLKYHRMNDQAVQRRILRIFSEFGIAKSRIRVETGGNRRQMLEAYSRVDIALDSFPYSGGITTCEALWMGVPLVTFPGATFAGRHATSYLTAAGLTELVALDRDDYIRMAIALGSDLERLALYRRDLRQKVANSPLCDGPKFARNLEAALLRVWNEPR